MSDIKEVRISFKKDEEWLQKYINKHSSPAAWLKDLAIADHDEQMKKEEAKPQTKKQFKFL